MVTAEYAVGTLGAATTALILFNPRIVWWVGRIVKGLFSFAFPVVERLLP